MHYDLKTLEIFTGIRPWLNLDMAELRDFSTLPQDEIAVERAKAERQGKELELPANIFDEVRRDNHQYYCVSIAGVWCMCNIDDPYYVIAGGYDSPLAAAKDHGMEWCHYLYSV